MKLTPEELVRQGWLKLLVETLGFPPGLISVEVEIGAQRRADIITYTKGEEGLKPLLLIECKAGPLTEAHRQQLIGYNHHVEAPYIALVNGEEAQLGWPTGEGYQFASGMPDYETLITRG